jgi:hypothetical protein
MFEPVTAFEVAPRRRGRRGDTTMTFVRRAQERADRGAPIAPRAASTQQLVGGVRGLIRKLRRLGQS